MTAHIKYGRLVNLGEFEHLRLEVEFEVAEVNAQEVRRIVHRVEEWAALAKKRVELQRDLRSSEHQLLAFEKWGVGVFATEDIENTKTKIAKARADLEGDDAQW